MKEFRPPVRDDLAGHMPYGAPQLDVDVRLNVNENPFPLSPAVVRAIVSEVSESAASLNRYPDRDFLALREGLSQYLSDESGVSVSPESIWAANGSNEVMAHIMAAFGGPDRSVLSFPPTYSMYPEYVRESFATLIEVPRLEDFSLDMPAIVSRISVSQPSITVLASPNNPTGTAVSIDEIATIAQACTSGVVVVDEAYAEFRRLGSPSAVSLLSEYPNLIVTRTMSKAFAMAGARLGYAAAHPSVIDALRIVRLPYHLSAITQAVAQAALRMAPELQSGLAVIRDERDHMVEGLRARGLDVAESDANFCLFGVFSDRHRVWQGLVQLGVLIRETGPEGWLRASVGTPEENARFMAALDEVLTDIE